MGDRLPPFLREAVPGWVAARRFGVPAAMVEQATANAPPQTLRAMLDAGADPRATDEYSEVPIVDHDVDSFEDLEFLRVAAGVET